MSRTNSYLTKKDVDADRIYYVKSVGTVSTSWHGPFDIHKANDVVTFLSYAGVTATVVETPGPIVEEIQIRASKKGKRI